MHQVKIIRIEENFNYGTFGVLLLNTTAFCVTLEPRDEENQRDISSIPAQQYMCEMRSSQKYGNVYEIKNVPGRTSCLFHAGNVSDHTQGCILLGRNFGDLGHDRGILASGETLTNFHMELNFKPFHLTIVEHYG